MPQRGSRIDWLGGAVGMPKPSRDVIWRLGTGVRLSALQRVRVVRSTADQ
jgi:hypothetical protein